MTKKKNQLGIKKICTQLHGDIPLLRLIGEGSGEKVGRPWPAWRGKRNAAELRKGWLCSVHALCHTLCAHTSALISPVYARAHAATLPSYFTRTRLRDVEFVDRCWRWCERSGYGSVALFDEIDALPIGFLR